MIKVLLTGIAALVIGFVLDRAYRMRKFWVDRRLSESSKERFQARPVCDRCEVAPRTD